MVGSDGPCVAPYGITGQGKPHPRLYGTFPRVLGHYARDLDILGLPQAVYKMTGGAAAALGLADRCTISEGKAADLVLFDPDTIADRAMVERVEAVAREIGGRLKALKPDLWLIFANDHAEQFFHNVAPPFTVHVGASASGNFAGRNFHWKVPGEIGFEIVKGLYRQG